MDSPKPISQHVILHSKNANKRLKTSDVLEEQPKKFNYNFIPSLEHLARVNVILLAWNHSGIKNRIICLLSSNDRFIVEVSVQWRQIEREVIEKIKKLPLPKSIIEIIICYAEEVGRPIIGWILYYENMILRRIQGSMPKMNHLENLVWTSRGTIDYKKTAQHIIHHDEITHTEKYLVACTFCLEDDIVMLTENRIVMKDYESVKRTQPMLWYWTFYIQGKIDELYRKETRFTEYDSIYHCLIDLIIYSGIPIGGENDAAVKYVWCKLTIREKERLIKPLLKLCSPECCCFLLSRSSQLVEQKILKKQSHNILKLFMKNNLWADEIISMIQYIFPYFNEERYSEIMKLLQKYLKYYRKKIPACLFMYNKYSEMLNEMWKLSTSEFKSDIFERDDHLGAEIIHALAWEISEKIIRLIFAEISPIQRKYVIESKYGFKKCIHFISTNQKSYFEEFLSLAFTEEGERSAFKKKLLKERTQQILSVVKKERGWGGLKDFFTWFFRLPLRSDYGLWHQLDKIFEKYYDDFSEKIKTKAQVLIYYLCEDNETDDNSSSKKQRTPAELKQLLNWYLSPTEFTQLQTNGEPIYLNMLIYFSIRENNFSLANDILSVFFFENNLSAIAYKKQFFRQIENDILIFHFIIQDDSFKSLKKYANWCFFNLDPTNLDDLLRTEHIIELLKLSDYTLIDEYITWLKISDEKKISLKDELMNRAEICTIARTYIENEINEFETTSKMQRLIEWISPSTGTIEMFYETYEEGCPLNFYHLLNHYQRKISEI